MSQIAPLSGSAAIAAATNGSSNQNGADFSNVLNEAILQTMADSVMSPAEGGLVTAPLDTTSYLQTSLLAGAQNGQTGQNELLMMMLMMMMQEFKGNDLTPLVGAMMAALSAPDARSGSGAGASGSAANGAVSLRPSPLSRIKSLTTALLPDKAWLPASFSATSSEGNRSASTLRRVLDQFQVESAERYRPGKNNTTYCNIFVWDATSALNCEIPHYVDRQTGAPKSYPDTAGAYELDANGTHDWLAKNGAAYGWLEINAEEAQKYANAGYPTVSAWKNKGGGAGHVQMVCPSLNGDYDAKRGVTVAQAGSKNYSYAHLNATVSKDKMPDVRYFVHA